MDLQTAQAALDQAAAAKQQAIAQVNQAKAQAQAARSQVCPGAGPDRTGQSGGGPRAGQHGPHHHQSAHRWRGRGAQRGCRPDRRRKPAGSRDLPDRERPDTHAGPRQHRRSRRRSARSRQRCDLHGGRLPARSVPRQGIPGPARAHDGAERRDLHRRDRRRERRPQAEARHDGQRHRDRASGKTCWPFPTAAFRFQSKPVPRPAPPAVWKIEGRSLTPVSVRSGLSDGVVTEVVSGQLQEGDKIATPAAASGTAKKAAPSMLPMGGRGGRRGYGR